MRPVYACIRTTKTQALRMVTTQTDQSILCNSKELTGQTKSVRETAPGCVLSSERAKPITRTPQFSSPSRCCSDSSQNEQISTKSSRNPDFFVDEGGVNPSGVGAGNLREADLERRQRRRHVPTEKRLRRVLRAAKGEREALVSLQRSSGEDLSTEAELKQFQAQLPAMERAGATGFRGERVDGLKHNPRTELSNLQRRPRPR